MSDAAGRVTPLRFAVIGSPVAHSRSPAMHGAAFAALGLPHTYEKLETSAEELGERVAALRSGAFAGLNVTVPHKTRVLAMVDEVDASARATGAANTLVRGADGSVCAFNTDAPALRAELARLAGGVERFRARTALVLGTGGAARAAIFALGQLDVGRVVVRGRRRDAFEPLPGVLAASGATRAAIAFEPIDAPPSDPSDYVAVVQATTAGMDGASAPGDVVADVVAWEEVPLDCVVYDVVYTPPRTPLLERARARGLACDGGLGMLVRQGALAFELWLGVEPPLDVMRGALD
ncbi:MAG: shikimate dehydrogenase [Labilithrix sp.]|nr:shikimate dehydrogenase [Labilithrix sp.]